MALTVDFKKGEKFFIGDTLILNDSHNRKFEGGARLQIFGDAPILRQKDIMPEHEADSPCKHIYLLVQSMYLTQAPEKYAESYFGLVRQIQHDAPGTASYFARINEMIKAGTFYKALKEIRNLIEYEDELFNDGKVSYSSANPDDQRRQGD
jgi:flagellar protein FlbT